MGTGCTPLLQCLALPSLIILNIDGRCRRQQLTGTDGLAAQVRWIVLTITNHLALFYRVKHKNRPYLKDCNSCICWRRKWSIAYIKMYQSVFSTLHGMPARTNDEKAARLSVCPSVCLSVKRVNCEKNGRKICPDFHTIRKII